MVNSSVPGQILSRNYEHSLGEEQGDTDEYFEWTTFEIILTPILVFIVFGTILGNLCVLMHFIKTLRKKDLHTITPTHFFIANLSLSDFLVGVLVLPLLASFQITGRWYVGQCLCTVWVCTHFWLCAASILSTCAVCIERYIGVKYPIQHMGILNVKRICMALLTVWVLAGIPSLVRVFAWTEIKMENPYKCFINQKIGHAILATVGIFYIPAIIMISLYFSIYRVAMAHMNSQKTGVGVSRGLTYQVSIGGSTYNSTSSLTNLSPDSIKSTHGPENETTKKGSIISCTSVRELPRQKPKQSIEMRQIFLTKRLAILVGVVLLSYGPYFTLILLKSIKPELVNPNVFDFFAWMRYFNSFINVFIYAYAVPSFNKAFRNSFLGRCVFSTTKH